MTIESIPKFSAPAAKLWQRLPEQAGKLYLSNVWCGKCRHGVTIDHQFFRHGQGDCRSSSGTDRCISPFGDLPGDLPARPEGNEHFFPEWNGFGHDPFFPEQRDFFPVPRQAVEIGAMEAGEGFQFFERAGLFEGLRIKLDSRMGSVDPRAAARRFLGRLRMRGAVRAEEIFRVA